MSAGGVNIYSATYSNVPVYEFNIDGNHVMRRRSDDWINATHILKVAEYDKPTRTRILEREVQKNVHEKVQGGYGKYQGTWIPLSDGRELAAKNGVLERLLPILDFVPGDRSPPPAPKHATAASRPRAPRANAASRRAQAAPAVFQPAPPIEYEGMDMSMHDIGTPDNESIIASESAFDDFDITHHAGPRKRRRIEDAMTQADREHQLWAEELLDYFMLQEGVDALPRAPEPPVNADPNRAIDERGHTALHWAAAMADVEVVKTLISRGARLDAQSKNGETPLMRSVLFTNSYDKMNMERLASLLIRTVNMQEWSGCTVFHHIAGITHSKKKYECARYYMDCILSKMNEVLSPSQIEAILNEQDHNGDTAITIAARNGARKCVRSLIGRNAAVDIPNLANETADQLIVQLNNRRRERNHHRDISSSPFQDESGLMRANGGAVQAPSRGIPFNPLQPHTSIKGALNGQTQELYRSESAMTLNSSMMPLVADKTKSLAQTMDCEMVDKENELAEAERVLAARRAERDHLEQEKAKLMQHEDGQPAPDDEGDEFYLQWLSKAELDCTEEAEHVQDQMLRELLAEEKAIRGLQMDADTSNENLALSRKDKLVTANTITHRMERRNKLLVDLVLHLGLAGVKRHDEFVKLITGALAVRKEDVQQLLPDIVRELEETAKMELEGA